MLRTPHAEGLEGALRVEVRGADRDGGRQTLIARIAERAGTAAAAMAAVFAGELVGGGCRQVWSSAATPNLTP